MSTAHVRRIEVPQAIGADDALDEPDYSSAFELQTQDAHALTPEQWARAVFEDAPALMRWFLLRGWTLVLGLAMGPRPSSEHILGWLICERKANTIAIQSRSRLLAARNVVLVNDSSVVWVTIVHFNRPIARTAWALAKPIHHIVIPYLLRRASPSSPRQ
jgi:hypothetical protein